MKAKRAVIGRCPWSIIGRHVKLVSFALFNIRFFAKYNNNLLGLRIVPRETENNGYAKSFFLGGGGGGGEVAGGEIIMVFSKVANGTRFENVC